MPPAPVIRLSRPDLTKLALETPSSPMHQAALGVLVGTEILDPEGHVRIDDIRADVQSKLEHIPELWRVLHKPGPLGGMPVWIDDPNFQIENHVLVACLPEPGGEAALLRFAETNMATLLDRSRPLWEIWLLESYADDRVGILIKVHHALVDGLAMVNLVGQLFDLTPAPHRDEGTAPRSPLPPPLRSEVVRENLAGKAAAVAHAASRLRHPERIARSAKTSFRGVAAVIRQGRGAPRMSFNMPAGVGRRIGVTRLPLAAVKTLAHARGVKLNDVFMFMIARGVREVARNRGEPVDGVQLRLSIAVSLHRADGMTTSGNSVGNMIVPLPMGDADALEDLATIASASAHAKATQRPAGAPGVMVLLSSTGLTRLYLRHQHLINLVATNLPGPPVPLFFAGARLQDIVALAPLAGNVTASFAALSYDGSLSLSVQADEEAWPDLQVLVEGMRSGWLELTGASDLRAFIAG